MSEVELRARGRLRDLDESTVEAVLDREPMDDPDVRASVAAMLADVRVRGDTALREMAERFDGVLLGEIEVPRADCNAALAGIDRPVRAALERAATNIRRFHQAQLPAEVSLEVEPGVEVTRCWVPLSRAGVYAPGGTAAYPSSVLMGVLPAKAAGVDEVVVCSPPGPSGRPPVEVLAACAIAEADRVFSLGGAGAVAAMTYGTQSVPRADVIVGPGNRWVTEAKCQVAGEVRIDSPAGPSEVLVLTDATSDPELAALELLAQAEHDTDAACVLVSTSQEVADAAVRALDALLASAPRADIARAALATAGAVLVADTIEEALELTEAFAPEHLSIMTQNAAREARMIRNAGTTFVGASSSVAFGDYMTGANHVLPTAGRARSFSGLSTHHFLRSFTIQEISDDGARAMAADVATLAAAEGLPAHARAAAERGDG